MQSAGSNLAAGYRQFHSRFPRQYWLALLIFTFGLHAVAYLMPILGRRESTETTITALAVLTIALAAVAVFAALMFARMTHSVLALLLGLAVSVDAASATLELLGYGTALGRWLHLSPATRPMALSWPFPALLLAGAWYTAASRKSRGPLRWLPGLSALAALALVGVAVPRAVSAVAADASAEFQMHAGLTVVQALALLSLSLLYQFRRDRLAGWAALSVLPGISVGLLLGWHGAEHHAASLSASVVRSGVYLLAGMGAWSVAKESLTRADRGRLLMQVSEQLRQAVLSSVESRVMATAVSRIVGQALELDEVAVLLRAPDQGELALLGTYSSRGGVGADSGHVFTPRFQSLVSEHLIGLAADLGHPVRITGSEAMLPLVTRDEEIGCVLASRKSRRGLPDADLLLLEIACGHLAMGLANAQLLLESQSRLNRAEALRRLAVQTNRDIPVAELAHLVVQQAKGLTGMERGELYLRDSTSGEFLKCLTPSEDQAIRMPHDDLYRRVLDTGQVQVVRWTEPGIAAPLIAGTVIVGVLAVHTKRSSADVTEEDEATLQALADQSVIALERARLSERVTKNQEETEALFSIGRDVSFVLDLQQGLERVAARSQRVLHCDVSAILLLSHEGNYSVPAVAGTLGESLAHAEITLQPALASDIASSNHPVVLPDIGPEPRLGSLGEKLLAEQLVSTMAVPLQANGQYLGAILVGHRVQHRFTQDEMFLAERISRQTAIAIENGRLLRSEQETVARLRELDSIKTNVIRSASHELRTPLVGIKGYTELLAQTTEDVLKPKQRRQLETIGRETDHILKLIDDMITASTVEVAGMDLQLARVPVREMLEHIVSAMRKRAVDKQIKLSLDAPDSLPEARADRAKLEQCLSSLMDNALKFTPEGGSVQVGVTQQGHLLRFAVSDTGIGVSPEDRPRLFQAFHRGTNVVDDAVPGTGLGLAICKRIVTAHGGDLGLEPERPAGGACFWFTIPLQGPPRAAP